MAGGPSNERDISLKSGRAVYEALLKEGCDVILLDVKNDIYDIIGSGAIDIAFIALHGRFGEDGTVQRVLEEMGLPYTGSGARASRLAFDKIAAKDVFRKCGIPFPEYAVLEKGKKWGHPFLRSTSKIKNECPNFYIGAKPANLTGWPVVVKPQFEGSSIGLSVASDETSFKAAVNTALGYGDKVLVEEYISGRELTVSVLGDKALPVIEIVTSRGIYDYEAKYRDPATRYLVPAPIDGKLAGLAGRLGERSHRSLGCRSFSRVDMMLDKAGKIFVLEVNTIPGMTERSLFPKAAEEAGIGFGALCIKLLEDAAENFNSGARSYHGSKEK